MVRNCQLSDLIYLTAPARAGAAEGVSVRERVGEPMGTEDTGFARPLPRPWAPSEGKGGASQAGECLPETRPPHPPTCCLPHTR